MFRGDGSLLVATRRGVRMTGLAVSAPAPPEPTWWAHDCACAWTAAWLTVRGARDRSGPREVLVDPDLKGTVLWSTRVNLRRSGHRPDLAVRAPGGLMGVEVELQRKNTSRMQAIVSMYQRWILDSKLVGVVYVCGSDARADRVYELANKVGIPSRALRIELLSDVREEAERYGSRSTGAAQAAPAARER
jgi:hypothetical protein